MPRGGEKDSEKTKNPSAEVAEAAGEKRDTEKKKREPRKFTGGYHRNRNNRFGGKNRKFPFLFTSVFHPHLEA